MTQAKGKYKLTEELEKGCTAQLSISISKSCKGSQKGYTARLRMVAVDELVPTTGLSSPGKRLQLMEEEAATQFTDQARR